MMRPKRWLFKHFCNSRRTVRQKKRRQGRYRLPHVEQLEERTLLATISWDGGGADDNWSTPENWIGDIAPVEGDDLVFGSAVGLNPYNDFAVGTVFGSITLVAPEGETGFTLSGNGVTLDSDGGFAVVNAGGNHTVELDVALGSDGMVKTLGASGTLRLNIGTSVDLNGHQLFVAPEGAGHVIVESTISGAGGLVKANTGRVTLWGANTYSGQTSVQGGTLDVRNEAALGASSSGTTIADGAVLELHGTNTSTLFFDEHVTLAAGALLYNSAGTNYLTGDIDLTGDAGILVSDSQTLNVSSGGVDLGASTLTVNTSGLGQASISSTISGTGGLVKAKAGRLTLTGANTYSGQTSVQGGTLDVRNEAALGASSSGTTVADGAVLELHGTNTSTLFFNEHLTLEAGSLLYNNSGTNYLTGGIDLTGDAGILVSDSKVLNVSSGGVNLGASTLTVNTSGTGRAAIFSVISGSGSLVKANTGEVQLLGANSYSGQTSVQGGTLVARNESALGSTTSGTTVADGGVLQLHGSNTSTLFFNENVTLAAGSLLYNSAGTNYLTGGIDLTGDAGILVSDSQTLNISSGGVDLGASTLTVNTSGLGQASISSTISGTGGLVKAKAGRLTLTGANTYSGQTSVQTGTLNVRNEAALGTSAGSTTVADGAVLELHGSNTNTLFFNEHVTLEGGSLLANSFGTNYLTGGIDLTGDAGILVSDSKVLNVSSGGVNLGASTLTVNTSGTGQAAIFSTISGTGGLVKANTGRLTLTGANTYSGQTSVQGGTLDVRNETALGASSSGTTVADGAVLELHGTNTSTLFFNEHLTLEAGSLLYNSSGTNYLTGGIDLTGDAGILVSDSKVLNVSSGGVNLGASTLTVYTSGLGQAEIFSTISGTGGLVKANTGTLTLGGENTYTGTTSVIAGTLFLDGSTAGDLSVEQSGATLGGSGTIDGPITVKSGGTLAPGNGTGILSGFHATFAPSSVYAVQINGPIVGDDYDQLGVTEGIDLGGSTLDVEINSTVDIEGEFIIINNEGADAVTGTFSGLPQGSILTVGATVFEVVYDGGDGNDVALIANALPVADAGGPYAINEGGPLMLDASASYDPDGDALTFTWDVNGDGVFGDTSGVSPMLTSEELAALGMATGPNSYMVTVRVDDGDGGVDEASATLSIFVDNDTSAPVINLFGPNKVWNVDQLIPSSNVRYRNEGQGPPSFAWEVFDNRPFSELGSNWGLSTFSVTLTKDSGAGPEQIYQTSDFADAFGGFTVPATDFGPGVYEITITGTDDDNDVPDDSLTTIATHTIEVLPGRGLVWENRGTASDRFDEVFGDNASAARAVVDAAIDDWNNVVTNFNFSDGTDGFGISLAMSPGNGLAARSSTIPSQLDSEGSPRLGVISIDAGNDGHGTGWWLDATPDDSAEFDIPYTAFTGIASSGSPASGMRDFYSTVAHEIGHSLGIAGSYLSDADSRGTIAFTDTGVTDDVGNLYFTVVGPNTRALHRDANGGTNGSHTAPENDTYVNPTTGDEFHGVDDLMNPTREDGMRRKISNLNALLLHDAFGYSITVPEQVGTFYANLNQETGELTVKGGRTFGGAASDDTVSIRRVGDQLVVTVDIENDVSELTRAPQVPSYAAYVHYFDVSDVQSITIFTGDPQCSTCDGGDDSVILEGWVGDVTIDGRHGSDTYIINFTGEGGTVTVADTGTTGDDRLIVQGTGVNDRILRGSSTIEIVSPVAGVVNYSGIDDALVQVDAPAGAGTIDIFEDAGDLVVQKAAAELLRTPLGSAVGLTVAGAAESEVFDVDVTGLTPANLPSGITLEGGEGVDDQDAVVVTGSFTDYEFTSTGPESGQIDVDGVTLSFSEIEPIEPDDVGGAIDQISEGGGTELQLNEVDSVSLDTFLTTIESLAPRPVGDPTFELTVNLTDGTYGGQQISVPEGFHLTIVGSDGTVWEGSSPALTVASGNVRVERMTFIDATDAPTVLITGGSLTVRGSRIEESTGFGRAAIERLGGSLDLGTAADPGANTLLVHGEGEVLRNAAPGDVAAVGNSFFVDGVELTSPFDIEDEIFHALDAGGGGLVTYVPDNVFVTPDSGSIQRGVDAVGSGGIVNVAGTSFDAFRVGDKELTVAYLDGPVFRQASDVVLGEGRSLFVTGTTSSDRIRFQPGSIAGDVDVTLGDFAPGTFSPSGRLVAFGGDGADDIQAAGSLALSAWFYGDAGNDRLKGGSGHDVLLGGPGDDLIVGQSGRDIIIGGTGADRLVGNADDDIVVAGTSCFDAQQAALLALLSEWTSDRDYQTRTANLRGEGVGERLNGDFYLIADGPEATIQDDGERDVMTGSSGIDWFFASLGSDGEDKVTDLQDDEFADVLDWILE